MSECKYCGQAEGHWHGCPVITNIVTHGSSEPKLDAELLRKLLDEGRELRMALDERFKKLANDVPDIQRIHERVTKLEGERLTTPPPYRSVTANEHLEALETIRSLEKEKNELLQLNGADLLTKLKCQLQGLDSARVIQNDAIHKAKILEGRLRDEYMKNEQLEAALHNAKEDTKRAVAALLDAKEDNKKTMTKLTKLEVEMVELKKVVLAEEIQYFEELRFIESQYGQFALIKDRRLIGVFDTKVKAYERGLTEFGTQTPMLIKQILEKDEIADPLSREDR